MTSRFFRFTTLALGFLVFLSLGATTVQEPRKVSAVDHPPVSRQMKTKAATGALDQPPNQSNGLFSDVTCSICSGGTQVIADNFVVSTGGAGFRLSRISVWGGFYPGNTPPTTDLVWAYVLNDDGGQPGTTVLCSAAGVSPTSRTATGVTLFGVSEYLVTLDLSAPCVLPKGTYWIELYYDTNGYTADDWFWEMGDLDPVYGVPGSAWAIEAPGVNWVSDAVSNLAVRLDGSTPAPSAAPVNAILLLGEQSP